MPTGRQLRQWLRDNRGLTLMELVIILAIIGTLSTIGMLVYFNYTDQARYARAVADISNISSEILTFEMTNERLPTDLGEVNRATFPDPWGNPYQYLDLSSGSGAARKDHALHPINSDFDLYSMGKDGQSSPPLTAAQSRDDIVRANDGQYIGPAANY